MWTWTLTRMPTRGYSNSSSALKCKHAKNLKFTMNLRSSGGVVVQLLACGASGQGLILSLTTMITEIGNLLLPSCDITKISLKWRKSSKQPTTMNLNKTCIKSQQNLLLPTNLISGCECCSTRPRIIVAVSEGEEAAL